MKNSIQFVKMQDNVELFTKLTDFGHGSWLVMVHGIGEHCERHNYLIDLFKDKYNILQFDLRGHGKSTGQRTYVNSFRDYKTDLEEILKFLKIEQSCQKYVLFGHSMGGLIVAGYMKGFVKDAFYPEKVYLSSPPAGIAGPLGLVVNRVDKSIFSALASLPVNVDVPGLVDIGNLSHDPEVQEDFKNDVRNAKKINSKLLLEMVKSSKGVFSSPLNIKCPAFCSVGSGDQIVDVESLKNYFYEHEKSIKLKVFKGAYHEIHVETPKYRDPYFEYLKECLS